MKTDHAGVREYTGVTQVCNTYYNSDIVVVKFLKMYFGRRKVSYKWKDGNGWVQKGKNAVLDRVYERCGLRNV